MHSLSEENYLKAIYNQAKEGANKVGSAVLGAVQRGSY